ncbi:hypothetical protein ACYSNW_14830 [Enterococcus sp. LJL99]
MKEEDVYSFILNYTKPECQDEMKQLLDDLKKRNDSGHLNKLYLMSIGTRAMSYIKPEHVNEVKDVVFTFLNK